MKIISSTHSTNPHYNGGCDYALVELTPKLAQRVLDRMKALVALAAADRDLHEAHYWDDHAEYFGAKASEKNEALDEDLLAAEEGYVVLAENVVVPPEALERMECCHMVITVLGGDAEIHWRASPKNDSIYLETNPLPRSLLEKIAAGGDSAQT